MKRAGGSAAVADASRADGAFDFLEPPRHQRAVDHRNHRAQMADHRQQAFAGPAAMHVAVAPAHRAESGAEISADGIQHRFAESQAAGAVADQRRKNIPFAQRHAQGDAQRLLAAAKKNAALNFSRAVKAGHFVIQHPRKEHQTKSLQILR